MAPTGCLKYISIDRFLDRKSYFITQRPKLGVSREDGIYKECIKHTYNHCNILEVNENVYFIVF